MIVPVGPAHAPQILRAPGKMKDRVPGAGKAAIHRHLKEVGAVGLTELREAVREGWLRPAQPDFPPMYPIAPADTSDVYELALNLLEGESLL